MRVLAARASRAEVRIGRRVPLHRTTKKPGTSDVQARAFSVETALGVFQAGTTGWTHERKRRPRLRGALFRPFEENYLPWPMVMLGPLLPPPPLLLYMNSPPPTNTMTRSAPTRTPSAPLPLLSAITSSIDYRVDNDEYRAINAEHGFRFHSARRPMERGGRRRGTSLTPARLSVEQNLARGADGYTANE